MPIEPAISVIIPCYNYGHFLAEAVSSVQEQTFKDWEILIIDDGSTDLTRQVANELKSQDPRIKYHYQFNQGLSAARNLGLSMASGKFIQLLDADDMIQHLKLERNLEFLLAHPEADLVYSHSYVFHQLPSALETFELVTKMVSGKGEIIVEQLIHDNLFLPGSPLFRKKLFIEDQSFNTSLSALEDWNFWIKSALKGRSYHYLNQKDISLLSRSHTSNMSASQKRMWLNFADARKDIHSLLKNKRHKSLNLYYMNLDLVRYHARFGSVNKVFFPLLNLMFYPKKMFSIREAIYCFRQRIKENGTSS